MNKTPALLFVSLLVAGCAFDAGDVEEETSDEPLGSAEGAAKSENSIDPNAIDPNAIDPNAIDPNAIDPNALDDDALTPSTIPSGMMTALQQSGTTGDLSRMLVKYLVSCAFDQNDSFQFSWSDSAGMHYEDYPGSLGIAPNWTTTALTAAEQRWVSACIAARANYYHIPVLLSLRGTITALGADNGERNKYDVQEGAFWGNIFSETPALYSCNDPTHVTYSRDARRECAAGHWDGSTTTECANIEIVGTCSTYCDVRTDIPGDGYESCDGVSEVVTVFLD